MDFRTYNNLIFYGHELFGQLYSPVKLASRSIVPLAHIYIINITDPFIAGANLLSELLKLLI